MGCGKPEIFESLSGLGICRLAEVCCDFVR